MHSSNIGALLIVPLALIPNCSHGQTPSKLDFEVASVRLSSPDVGGGRPLPGSRNGGPGTTDPGRITYSREELNLVLADAFDVYWDQISGPDWIGTERYDISANVPDGTTKEQARQMLQNLLAERLGLICHKQTKSVRGYELMLSGTGPTLKEPGSGENAPAEAQKDSFPIPPLPPGEHVLMRPTNGHVFVRFADSSITELAAFLSAHLSPAESQVMLSPGHSRTPATPLLDETGLKGRYDFTFDYAGGLFFTEAYLPSLLSSIETSLNKQLGLKLVEGKVTVNTLVIDHIEKTPTEN